MPIETSSPDDAFKTPSAGDVAVIEPDEVEDTPMEESDEDRKVREWLEAEEEWKEWFDPGWKHERVEYKGDYLAVYTPLMQALGAFQLSSSKFIPAEKQNDMAGLFVDQHLGPESYDQVMKRLMSPTDPGYTTKSVSELMGLIMDLAIQKIKAEREADKALEKENARKGIKGPGKATSVS